MFTDCQTYVSDETKDEKKKKKRLGYPSQVVFSRRWIVAESISPRNFACLYISRSSQCSTDWCMCYPVCGIMHIKESLLLIGKIVVAHVVTAFAGSSVRDRIINQTFLSFMYGLIISGRCPSNVNTTNPCVIPIKHVGTSTDPAYATWSKGDNFLDWYGSESSQGRYAGFPADGTPSVNTTNRVDSPSWHTQNTYV